MTSHKVAYALADTPLGKMLLASTIRGICAISFGETANDLIERLRARFPDSDTYEDPEALSDKVELMINFISAPAQEPPLPLDIQGTRFQQRVWSSLRAIPPGQTISYEELAMQIGQPRAVRAVARACASNTIAVAIPCHRVIGKHGNLSGYRWGLERKRELLKREASATAVYNLT